MTLDLTDDEKLALMGHLRHALEYDPFPYAPRLDPLNLGEARGTAAAAEGRNGAECWARKAETVIGSGLLHCSVHLLAQALG
jgi:hypothetical protein